MWCLGRERDGVYPVLTANELTASPHVERTASALAVPGRYLETWYRRMRHVNFKTLKWMAEKKVIKGFVIKPRIKPPMCVVCALTKAVAHSPPSERSDSDEAVAGVLHDLSGR